jgi:hypothetical protein
MIPRQLREDTVVLHGSYDGHTGDFRTRSTASDNLDDYLWAHPSTELVSTAELLVYSPGMLVEVFYTDGRIKGARNSFFVGSIQEILGESKLTSAQPRLVSIEDEAAEFATDVCRNNSVALVRTLNAYGMSQHERACVLAVCSDYAYGSDLADEEYKMREPLRLIIEENVRKGTEEELYECFRQEKKRLLAKMPTIDSYAVVEPKERHAKQVFTPGYFKGAVDDDGDFVPVSSIEEEGETKIGVMGWYMSWLESLSDKGYNVESAGEQKPDVDVPK